MALSYYFKEILQKKRTYNIDHLRNWNHSQIESRDVPSEEEKVMLHNEKRLGEYRSSKIRTRLIQLSLKVLSNTLIESLTSLEIQFYQMSLYDE